MNADRWCTTKGSGCGNSESATTPHGKPSGLRPGGFFVPQTGAVNDKEVKKMTTPTQTSLQIGGRVAFIDPNGRPHEALVTAIHGPTNEEERKALYDGYVESGLMSRREADANLAAPFIIPSINLVHISREEEKTDTYGRQIERATSVPHESTQTANGYKYEFV